MRKIAIDIRNVGKQRTGDEVVFVELVRALAAVDDDNEYYLLIDYRTEEEIAVVTEKLHISQKENFRVVQTGHGDKVSWNVWSVARYCKREKIDIYHTQYIVPLWLPRVTKLVTHIHDVSFAALPQFIPARDLFLLRLFIPWSLKRADKIIAISQFTKDEIVKYYNISTEKIVIISNAVSADFLEKQTAQNIARVQSIYHLPEKYVFSLGTMQPRKNIPFLVAAFASIADKMPGMHLVLSGKRGYHFDTAIKETIITYPEIAQRVHFTGFIAQKDLPAVYAGATLFAFPSLYEGFGVPLLEAQTQGIPIIASDIPVFREVFPEGDITFCAPDDLDSFAQALYTVAKQRESYPEKIKTVTENYSWKDSAKSLMRLYSIL